MQQAVHIYIYMHTCGFLEHVPVVVDNVRKPPHCLCEIHFLRIRTCEHDVRLRDYPHPPSNESDLAQYAQRLRRLCVVCVSV